jgi:hypothetical protein
MPGWEGNARAVVQAFQSPDKESKALTSASLECLAFQVGITSEGGTDGSCSALKQGHCCVRTLTTGRECELHYLALKCHLFLEPTDRVSEKHWGPELQGSGQEREGVGLAVTKLVS